MGPSAPLGQDGSQGAGPATVPAGRANLQNGTVSVAGACQSIPEAPRRVGGPRRIAGERSAAGEAGERPFVTIAADDYLSGDVLVAATPAQGGEQPHAHQSGRQCETPRSACPKPRDVPPFDLLPYRQAGCIRELAWADLCPKQTPLRRGPCCDGLTRERSQVGPLSMSAAPAQLSTPISKEVIVKMKVVRNDNNNPLSPAEMKSLPAVRGQHPSRPGPVPAPGGHRPARAELRRPL